MNYQEMTRVWERFAELPVHCDRETLRGVVLEEAEAFSLPQERSVLPFVGEPTQDILLFICYDEHCVVGLSYLPASRIDEQLRRALALLHGCVFANAADLEAEQWDAALRLMSALAEEMPTVRELAAWGEEEGSSLTEEDLARYWECWLGCDVTRWEQLQQTPSAVCAIRRAM